MASLSKLPAGTVHGFSCIKFCLSTEQLLGLYHYITQMIFFFDLVLGPGKIVQQYINQCFRSRSGFNSISGSGLGIQIHAGQNCASKKRKKIKKRCLQGFRRTFMTVFDQKIYPLSSKILVWIGIRIGIGSGFSNSLDLDPDSKNTDSKH